MVVLGILLLAAAGPGLGPAPNSAGLRSPAPAVHGAPVPLAIGPTPGHLHMLGPSPSYTPVYYTQIGATLSQVNGSYASSGFVSISELIPLVVSPYPIGYELNGLSDTGDWYQIVVADNWPGCASGFEEVTEVWDNLQQSGPVNCDPTLALSKGDLTQLTLTVTSSSQVCLGLSDITTKRSHQLCQSQPDSGATEFILLSSAANAHGYYTGTMTEVVNTTASSCPKYTLMPTVTFDFPRWADVTGYVGWSDERDVGGAGTVCYNSATGLVGLGSGDPSSHFADSTGSSQYGPHYIEGQNDSYWNSSYSFRFQSDAVPLSTPTISASSLAPNLGQSVSLQANGSGGVAPYGRAIWSLNGSLRAPSSAWWNWTANGSGNYTITVFVSDSSGDASPRAAPIVVRVPFHVWVGPVTDGGRTGADVNQTIAFAASAGGGAGWLAFTWSGLPTGCASSNRSAIPCSPGAPGTFSVQVSVHDALGSTQASPTFSITVSPDPIVVLTGDRAIADVGQNVTFRANVTGGAGGFRIAWSNLPPGCASSALTVTCPVSLYGSYPVTVTATDANGFAQRPAPFTLLAFRALAVSTSANLPIVDAGVNLTVTAVVSGGAGNVSYDWTGLPDGCSGANASAIRCVPSSAGTNIALVRVTDRAGGTAESGNLAIVVAPGLSAALAASATSVPAPGRVTFSLTIAGGSLIRSTTWNGYPAGCPTPAPVATCTGLAAGTYEIAVTLVDVGGGTATAHVQVVVHAVAPPPPASNASTTGGLPTMTIALLAVVLVIAAAVALVALGLRRRGK